MEAERDKPRRRGRYLIGFGVLAWLVGMTALAVSVFNLGVLTGLAIFGGSVLVYVVTAASKGWPLPTADDIVTLVTAIVGAIVAAILSIFD